MTPHEKLVILLALVAAVIVVAIGARFVLAEERRRDTDLPGGEVPAPSAGEYHDDWDQLDPDQAADILIAEWHDEPLERTVTADVWDQWWQGIDGLEREVMLTHDWYVREERLWAELKAETRELCAA